MTHHRLSRFALALLAALTAAPTAAKTAAETPTEGQELPLHRPTIAFTFTLPEGIARTSLRIVVDGTDVSEFQKVGHDRIKVVCPLPLADGEHTAELRGRGEGGSDSVLAKVGFRTVPPRQSVLVSGRVSGAPRLEVQSDKDDGLTIAPHVDGRIDGPAGNLAYSLSMSHRFNLEGPSESVLPPDALAELDRDGLRLRAGTLTEPMTFSGSELMGSAAHRRAAEARLAAGSLGALAAFTNFFDAMPVTSGERSFRQAIHGLSWAAPIRAANASFTLFAMFVRDQPFAAGEGEEAEASFTTPQRGTVFGARATKQLARDLDLAVEAARSDRRVAEGDGASRSHDWATRISARAKVLGQQLELRLAHTGTRFGNPANPGIDADRREARLELTGKRGTWTYKLDGGVSRDGLDELLAGSDEVRFGGSLRGRAPGKLEVALSAERQDVDRDGDDRHQTKTQLALKRAWPRLKAEIVSGWSSLDRPAAERRSESAALRGALQVELAKGLTFRGGGGRDRRIDTHAATTILSSIFLEPSWQPPAGVVRIAFNFGRATRETVAKSDHEQLMGRGSVTFVLPPRWQRAELTFDATWSSDRDRLSDSERIDRRVGFQLGLSPEALFPR